VLHNNVCVYNYYLWENTSSASVHFSSSTRKHLQDVTIAKKVDLILLEATICCIFLRHKPFKNVS